MSVLGGPCPTLRSTLAPIIAVDRARSASQVFLDRRTGASIEAMVGQGPPCEQPSRRRAWAQGIRWRDRRRGVDLRKDRPGHPSNPESAMHSSMSQSQHTQPQIAHGVAARSLSDLYSRLKRIAGRQLGQSPSPATLSATVLVHEAYLRVAGGGHLEARDESHLLSLWTRTMRHVLIDYCRARATAKRSGHKLDIDELDCAQRADPDALLALEQSLRALDAHDPRLAQVIELRVFAGLDSHGIAAQLGVDVRTVQRDWVRARAWLQDSLAAG